MSETTPAPAAPVVAPDAPAPDADLAALEGLQTTIKARVDAYESRVKAFAATPEALAVAAKPKPTRESPAAYVGFGAAAKRSLAKALEHAQRAHAELTGHLNFAAEAEKQFAARNAPAAAVGTKVPSSAEVEAWAKANGYAKTTPAPALAAAPVTTSTEGKTT